MHGSHTSPRWTANPRMSWAVPKGV
jgi:hypothetical protein